MNWEPVLLVLASGFVSAAGGWVASRYQIAAKQLEIDASREGEQRALLVPAVEAVERLVLDLAELFLHAEPDIEAIRRAMIPLKAEQVTLRLRPAGFPVAIALGNLQAEVRAYDAIGHYHQPTDEGQAARESAILAALDALEEANAQTIARLEARTKEPRGWRLCSSRPVRALLGRGSPQSDS